MIFLVDDFNALVFFGVSVGDFFRVISGAVINQNDFKILVGLVKYGVKTFW